MLPRPLPIWIVVATCVLSSCGCSGDNDVAIQGAGATFPAPLYKRWFLEYYKKHPDVRVNYQAIGSGAGIRQFNEDLLDFGASDAFEQPKKIEAILLPMTAGSIALLYHLPDGPKNIKLSRDVYVDIFLGKITQWNDPRIEKDNPGVTLPATDIKVVVRQDASGTSHVFTSHLTKISPDKWDKDGPGKGPGKTKSLKPPQGGFAGRGNSGVTAIIKLTPGAIGYVELSYATLSQKDMPELSVARLENKRHKFVSPTLESNRVAVASYKLDEKKTDFNIAMADPDGDDSYPIVSFTWMIVRRRYDDPRKGKAMIDVLNYCLGEGQKISPELEYIPLPERLVERVKEAIKTKIVIAQTASAAQ